MLSSNTNSQQLRSAQLDVYITNMLPVSQGNLETTLSKYCIYFLTCEFAIKCSIFKINTNWLFLLLHEL